jgi:hypothetical protein
MLREEVRPPSQCVTGAGFDLSTKNLLVGWMA